MKTRQEKDILVVSPFGYMTGGEETEEMDRELKRALADDNIKKVVLDCSDVQHLGSDALAALTKANNQAIFSHKRFSLVSIKPHIQHVFRISKLSLIFDVYPTIDDATTAWATEDGRAS